MSPSRHLTLALLLIACGVLVGRTFSAGTRHADSADHRRSPGEAPRRPGSGGRTAEGEVRRDLRAFKKLRANARDDPSGLRREMERLSVPALKNLILDLPNQPAEDASRWTVMKAALAELYRREGVGALEWCADLEAGPSRKFLMEEVITASVRDNADLAKPWIDRFEMEYGRPIFSGFFREAWIGAKDRGADELLKVRALFPDKVMSGTSLTGGDFAPDFDFGKYVPALAGAPGTRDAIYHWSTRDKDAAWEEVKRTLLNGSKSAGSSFTAVVAGAINNEGEVEGVKWAVSRLEGLSPDQRSECIRGLDSRNLLTREGVAAVVGSLAPEDRQVFAETALIRGAATEKVLVALESLSRPDLVDSLENAAREKASFLSHPEAGAQAERERRKFAETGARFSLTPEEMARVDAAMGPPPGGAR